jgi:uncharacterized membrane protein
LARLVLAAFIVFLLLSVIAVVALGLRAASSVTPDERTPGIAMQKIAYSLLAVLILYVAFYGAV